MAVRCSSLSPKASRLQSSVSGKVGVALLRHSLGSEHLRFLAIFKRHLFTLDSFPSQQTERGEADKGNRATQHTPWELRRLTWFSWNPCPIWRLFGSWDRTHVAAFCRPHVGTLRAAGELLSTCFLCLLGASHLPCCPAGDSGKISAHWGQPFCSSSLE